MKPSTRVKSGEGTGKERTEVLIRQAIVSGFSFRVAYLRPLLYSENLTHRQRARRHPFVKVHDPFINFTLPAALLSYCFAP